MRVLVVYASRYGSTRGIAERIGAILRQQGLQATVQSVESADNPADYDAAVIGSATYYFHWLKRASEFVWRSRAALASRPIWLFSSGPLGTQAKDSQGRDLCAVAVPKEIAEISAAIHPREHRVFFGALHHKTLHLGDALVWKLVGRRRDTFFPEGDFRDWLEIEAWARDIARALKGAEREVILTQAPAA